MTSKYKRFMSINAISTFGWWSFALIAIGRKGIQNTHSSTARALLDIPLWAGWILFAATFTIGYSIFTVGKPIRCIPPQYRKAARMRWDDGKPLL